MRCQRHFAQTHGGGVPCLSLSVKMGWWDLAQAWGRWQPGASHHRQAAGESELLALLRQRTVIQGRAGAGADDAHCCAGLSALTRLALSDCESRFCFSFLCV